MSPQRIIVPVIALIALGCLALMTIGPAAESFRFIAVGLIFGTLFGQSTLAAAWSALGPLPLIWRLPLSLLWIAALVSAFFVNVVRHSAAAEFIIVLAASLLGQWLIVQTILWGLAVAYGWRLHFQAAADYRGSAPQPRDRQFGIRQLMIVTAIIGVLLGTGRIILTNLPPDMDFARGEAPVVIFLGVSAILITLPLLVAAFLPKWAVGSCAVLLVIIGAATVWQFPLLALVDPAVPKDVAYLLFAINFSAAAWILAFVAAARLCGYGTTRRLTKHPTHGG